MSDQHVHLLALCAIPGVSWHAIARGAQTPGGLERLLSGLGEVDTHIARAREEIRRAQEQVGARLVTVLDDAYPANLRLVFNLPPFLFVRGELRRDDAVAVAVVGARQASEAGLKRARQMARALVGSGVTVVSGLANGIDTAAHEEALERGGRTIAVLGTGILRTYPAENRELAERIAGQGALVSQFWPSQPPARHTFPRRNVVTSGLSQGTVVIEASSTSGAKMQARLALQHGKHAFLVTSLVTAQSWAQRYLSQYPRAVQVASVAEVMRHLQSRAALESIAEGRTVA